MTLTCLTALTGHSDLSWRMKLTILPTLTLTLLVSKQHAGLPPFPSEEK